MDLETCPGGRVVSLSVKSMAVVCVCITSYPVPRTAGSEPKTLAADSVRLCVLVALIENNPHNENS